MVLLLPVQPLWPPQKSLFSFCFAQGTEVWSSPLQPAALVNLAAYPRLQLVVTVDKWGLIKTWKAENGRESASFSLPTSSSALQACDHPETPFLLVSEWLSGSCAGPADSESLPVSPRTLWGPDRCDSPCSMWQIE